MDGLLVISGFYGEPADCGLCTRLKGSRVGCVHLNIVVRVSQLHARMAIKAHELCSRSWKVRTLNKMSLV